MPDGLERITYAQLAARVEEYARQLGANRRLVALAARNDIDSLVAYLGALSAGCVVLLTAEITSELLDTYDPDVVIDAGPPDIRRARSAHRLHPELALLLSTSGSTGSPKLVRLSAANLMSNADAIAEYLAIDADDRAATTLPMFYCYGLSVVHSHLLRGASLLLTDRSVLDDEFWVQFRRYGATSFAAVPYTIDLLDRVGFAEMILPSLRYITQAGGRLAPERVRAYARLGKRAGWDFVVMYGQTEATARMAYLPPELAAEHPGCIGKPIPGGRFTLEPVPDTDDEELVYHGPNVMLGYADGPRDLARGRTVESLHTGDLARCTPEGLYQVVGRHSRFAKIFGLRIDLQRLESGLAAAGFWRAAPMMPTSWSSPRNLRRNRSLRPPPNCPVCPPRRFAPARSRKYRACPMTSPTIRRSADSPHPNPSSRHVISVRSMPLPSASIRPGSGPTAPSSISAATR